MKARLQIVTTDDQGDYILQKPGKYLFFLFNFSGKLNIEIQNSHIQAFVYGVYIGKGTDRFEVKTIQSHQAGNSISDLHLKGVFFDEAKFLYEGLIKIHKNAQLSNAYQKNQNLIMSPNAFVDSRPFLEIEANDVRCTHGSTTGRIDPAQLLYLACRGIAKDHGEKLIIEGFIHEVFVRAEEIAGTDARLVTLHDTILDNLHDNKS